MAKKQKKAVVEAVAATVAPVAVEAPVVVEAAKVTKRSQVLTNAVIELGDKPSKMRAGHNTKVWDAVCAILPATAAELMKLPELNEAPIVAGVMLSYMLRRGYLKQAEAAQAE